MTDLPTGLELPDVEVYSFQDWLETTMRLQKAAYDHNYPDDWVDDEGNLNERGRDTATWNLWAAVSELVEMGDEFGWKPWASSRHVNREQIIKEAVDLLHFVANLLTMASCTGQELTTAYRAKQLKNLARQIEGYDGVTGKCANCHRELSDVPKEVRFSPKSGLEYCGYECYDEKEGQH